MSTIQLNPYLIFNGTCREAMTFYQQCLGGDLQIQTFAGTPGADHVAPEAHQNVMHAKLTSGEVLLMASDSGGQPIVPGNSVSLSLNFHSPEAIADTFAKLGEGGQVPMPLADTFWGATFGMLTDRFGTNWMLNYDKPTAETQPHAAQAAEQHA